MNLPSRLLNYTVAALWIAGGISGLFTSALAAVAPKNTALPAISGTFQVGSTITVNPGAWSGDHPLTFAYKYQICSTGGTNCTVAPGLFANNGPCPTLFLEPGTAGKTLKVIVTATNPAGKKAATSAFKGPIAAYPSTAAPRVEFVNGLPEQTSFSNKSIFQFNGVGTAVTYTCQLDNTTAKVCPATKKVTYGNLAAGSHTVKVTAGNANGSSVAGYTWTVQPLPLSNRDACRRADGTLCYRPPVYSTWQWQLNPDAGQTGINTGIVADMYDIDGYSNDATVVSKLKSLPGTSVASRAVTCYITAGTLENWRPDSELLDPQILGNPYSGFVDERWIDIRQLSKLRPWLEAKMDMCKAKGFDAVEFDNVDGWSTANKTGLNITPEDEVAFIVYMSWATHERGMSMALKSDVEQVPQVLDYVDFAVVEECFEYQECTRNDPNSDGTYGYDLFINAGKPVFEVEYNPYSSNGNVCSRANALKFSTLYKNVMLDSYRVSCN